MHKGIIVQKDAGKLIPMDYLQSMKMDFSSCMGAMLALDGRVYITHNDKVDLDSVQSFQKDLQDQEVVFFFGNYPKDSLEEDIQPFLVIPDNDTTAEEDNIAGKIGVCLDGDFSDRLQPANAHSGEYHTAFRFIAKKFEKILKYAEDKIDAFLTELKDEVVLDELQLLSKNKTGAILVLTCDGTLTKIMGENNHLWEQYDWGWASRTGKEATVELDVTPAGAAEPVAKVSVSQKLANLFTGNKTKTDTTIPPQTGQVGDTKIHAKPAQKPIASVLPLQPSAMQKAESQDVKAAQYWVPPADINKLSKNKRKQLFRDNCGYLPMDWDKGKHFKIEPGHLTRVASGSIKSFAELGEKLGQTSVPSVTPAPAKVEEKKPEPAPAAKPAAEKVIPAATVPIPVLSAASLERLNRNFLQTSKIKASLDANSTDLTLDPSKYPTIEEKYPDFITKTGLKGIHQVFGWEYTDFLKLSTEFPDAAAMLMQQMQTEIIKTRITANQTAVVAASPAPALVVPEKRRLKL